VGSGHVLVEAYDLFKAIYLERGYQRGEVPQLILEKNLFGLDIDPRAEQLASFALVMKGREDDPLLLQQHIQPNIMAIRNSDALDVTDLEESVNLPDGALSEIKRLYQHGSTLGSLIRVPGTVSEKLPTLERLVNRKKSNALFSDDVRLLQSLVRQTKMLRRQYDVVVTNPPYMGSQFHAPILKRYLTAYYKNYKADLYSAFVVRNLEFSKPKGRLGFMTSSTWMSISSHAPLRKHLLNHETLTSFIQLDPSGFKGAGVSICTFTLRQGRLPNYKGGYIRLEGFNGVKNQAPRALEAIASRDCEWFYEVPQDIFRIFPERVIAYWVSNGIRNIFDRGIPLGELVDARQGLISGNNNYFLRRWWEVNLSKCGFCTKSRAEAQHSGKKWFPATRGVGFANGTAIMNTSSTGRMMEGPSELLAQRMAAGRDPECKTPTTTSAGR